MTSDEVSVILEFAKCQDVVARKVLGDMIEESGYPEEAKAIRQEMIWIADIHYYDGRDIHSIVLLCSYDELKTTLVRHIHNEYKHSPLTIRIHNAEVVNKVLVNGEYSQILTLTREDFA